MKNITKILETIDPISLEEMDTVKLLDRTDTKFIYHIDKLEEILKEASQKYRVLTIDSKNLFQYDSLYFDTPDHKMYLAHHNGKNNRYKIRFREYVDSGKSFLEVKFKNNKARTLKKRVPASGIEQSLGESSLEYLRKRSPFDPNQLEAKLWTKFRRFTLVHKQVPERLTIDLNLVVERTGQEVDFPFLVITEVKRDRSYERSDFIKILMDRKIHPTGLSKYCLGTIMLYREVKYNRFKTKILSLNKMSRNDRFINFIN